METILLAEKSLELTKDQTINRDYILNVINDRNSLLIGLNRCLITDECDNELINVLMQIHCTHSDIYVKYISAKVLINHIIKSKQNIEFVSHFDWHCLPQMCKFLCQLWSKVSAEECVGIESVVTQVSNKLIELSECNSQICDDHCLCYTTQLALHIHCLTNEQNLNNILLKLIRLNAKHQKRCFVNKFLNVLISVVKQNENNSVLMKSISDWILDQDFFTQTIHISNTLYAFGGRYASDCHHLDNDYKCDVVLIRQSILLYLLTLSSQFIMKSKTEEEIRNGLELISQFVRNKCKKLDENDWIIRLFIEEDEQLLCGLYCIVKLGDNQMSHSLMNSFIESINCDSSVLLDMLCSDEQTAIILLKLFLIYLKLTDITINIAFNVRTVLLELNDKMQRLSSKQLFPYNVNPLIRLLNKLKL